MILKIYAVKDKLVGFGGPMAFKDDKVAERWFEAFCKSKKEQEFTEAKYFDLYFTGLFDTESGVITGNNPTEVKLIREGEAFNEPTA